MEKTFGECKEKQVIQYCSSPEQVKLAALAVSLNIRLRSSDMSFLMQEHALRLARSLLDASTSRRPSLTLLARSIKKEFDGLFGPAWHCIAGKSFGSFVTHSPGGFVYFSADSYSFLLFKTESVIYITDAPKSLPVLLLAVSPSLFYVQVDFLFLADIIDRFKVTITLERESK